MAEEESGLMGREGRERTLRPGRVRRALSCAGVIAAVPAVLTLILLAIFLYNNRPVHFDVPTQTPPPNNAYNDFVRAGRMAKAMKHPSPLSTIAGIMGTQPDSYCAACATEAAPILAILHDALAKPYLHPQTRLSYADLSRDHAPMRELARLVSGVADYYARMGKHHRAVELLLDGLEMGVAIPKGGGLSAESTGSSCEQIAALPMDRLIPKLPKEELAFVARRLDEIATRRVPYLNTILESENEDTASYQDMFGKPEAQGPMGRIKLSRDLLWIQDGDPLTWRDRWAVFKLALASKTAMIQDMRRRHEDIAGEVRRPWSGPAKATLSKLGFTVRFLQDFKAEMRERSENEGPTTAAMDVLIRMRTQAEAQNAILDLFRVSIALRRYRAAHGRFPDSFQPLVPAYLKSIPNDPFTGAAGAPFRYRRHKSGFLLYSVGPDMRDDGGIPMSYPDGDESGDIVAGDIWPRWNRSK